MKPILVGDCSNYSYDTNNCTKCGRSMPDLCVEFEDMKRKAEAYDQINRDSSSTSDTDIPNKRSDGPPVSTYIATVPVDPYVQKAATRKGRPPKAKA